MRSPVLKILSSALVLFLFLFTTTPTLAFTDADIQEYCNARSGNVINLETWYSGKCLDAGLLNQLNVTGGNILDALTGLSLNENFPTQYSGEYRGFSDIVILDLYTRLTGDNPDIANNLLILGYTPPDSAVGSLALFMGQVISTPPASSIDYLAYIGQNMNNNKIVKPAYAQEGFGFISLGPVLEMWKGLRNIAYSVFIIAFIVYGFMIMFRVKIDPRVTTSFQLAIPKLILTLLLITFSYAIAGLIIDASYVISIMVGTSLEASKVINTEGFLGVNVANQLSGKGLGFGAMGVQNLLKIIFTNSIGEIESVIFGVPSQIIGFFGLISGVNLIIRLVLVIALIVTMLKILFMFIQSYAKIILNIIFSPIILLGNILPGSNAFSGWAKNLVAEISVFPVVITLWLIGGTLIRTGVAGVNPASPLAGQGYIWTPPGFGGAIGGNSAAGAGALIGYGILLISPKLADMIRDAFSIKPFKYGSAIGEAMFLPMIGKTAESAFQNKILYDPKNNEALAQQAGRAVLNRFRGANKGTQTQQPSTPKAPTRTS